MKTLYRGYSLLELLFTLSIIAIISTSIPAFTSIIKEQKKDLAIDKIYKSIQYTKLLAINELKIITLCGTHNGIDCSKSWNNAEIMIFHDQNNNKRFDKNDTLYLKSLLKNENIEWRGSNRRYTRFHPKGYLLDWGRFTYCPSDDAQKTTIQLVLNRRGRGYKLDVKMSDITKSGLCQ